MTLNLYNNFRAIYYNTLANFYLYFNTIVPYYDDVILSLSITSFKNIINNSKISLKSIKEGRLLQLISFLDDKDKLVIDDDGFIFIDYYPKDNDDDEDDEGGECDNNVVDTVDTTVEPTTSPTVDTVADTVADTECYNSIDKKNQ